MKKKTRDNNQVSIMGTIGSEPVFNHKIFGEAFYTFELHADRNSDRQDILPLMVSDRLFDIGEQYTGRRVKVQGQFRSRNRWDGKKNRLVLTVFVKELTFLTEASDDMNVNDIFIDGYVCKEPVYRRTPLGREISDVLIAVNREYAKSDYLPCICWGRNAKYAKRFKVGEHVQMWGRVQSRDYEKKLEGNQYETRTAYEVSVERVDSIGKGKTAES